MKNLVNLFVFALVASLAFIFAGGGIVEDDNTTTIITHKKGWASVLELHGDRGTGLYIKQGNKKATGIKMKSGNAQLELSPSYVAAGVKSDGMPFNRERSAVVFKAFGTKGGDGYVAFDVGSQQILWFDEDGQLLGDDI